jgi:hypothetical protein
MSSDESTRMDMCTNIEVSLIWVTEVRIILRCGLKETAYEDVDWIYFVGDTVQWRKEEYFTS